VDRLSLALFLPCICQDVAHQVLQTIFHINDITPAFVTVFVTIHLPRYICTQSASENHLSNTRPIIGSGVLPEALEDINGVTISRLKKRLSDSLILNMGVA
jgi:hypothetical protein